MGNEEQPAHKPVPRRHKRLVIAVVALLIIAGAIGASWYVFLRQTDPFSADIKQSTKIGLYYPQNTPLDKHTISVTNGGQLVNYVAEQRDESIYIAIQQKPKAFEISAFENGLKNATRVSTDVGTAAVGTIGGRRVGSLATANDWILATAPETVSADTISAVLQRMVRAN